MNLKNLGYKNYSWRIIFRLTMMKKQEKLFLKE